ncbi:MAG: arylamine N-acetyltransferase [Dehalococcoidia bacterium]
MARNSFGGDGARYLVDAGNGAPFFTPIPLDRTTEVRGVGLAYRFRPDAAGEVCVQDRLINNTWESFCRYDLRRPSEAEREAAYQRHHTPGQSWMVGTPRLIRCEPEALYTLRDGAFSRYTPNGKQTRPVSEPAEFERLVAEVFRMPTLPIAEGIAASAELNAAAAV